MTTQCSVAETIAGAIALGEAGDAEREVYRTHLAGCARCVQELGGERELERVIAVISQARDDERWEPDVRKALVRRGAPRLAWRWGAALAAAFIAIAGAYSLGNRASVAPTRTISEHEARAIAALGTETSPRREGRAESLVVALATPVTTSFTLSVDRRGTPLRCTITKSSGDPMLDRTVCRAALRAHYRAP